MDEVSEKELKSMFRRACNLCHPDKVPEHQKAEASEIFIKLKEAYDSNNVEEVEIIYSNLQKVNLSIPKPVS